MGRSLRKKIAMLIVGRIYCALSLILINVDIYDSKCVYREVKLILELNITSSSHLKHDPRVINADERYNFRSGRHDFGNY